MGNVGNRTFLLAGCLVVLAPMVRLEAAPQEQVEFFETKIRPIFTTKCQPCHGAQQRMAGLDLTSAVGFGKGPDSGPLVDTADLDNSRLLKAVSYQERIKMPPT